MSVFMVPKSLHSTTRGVSFWNKVSQNNHLIHHKVRIQRNSILSTLKSHFEIHLVYICRQVFKNILLNHQVQPNEYPIFYPNLLFWLYQLDSSFCPASVLDSDALCSLEESLIFLHL